nr:protein kinase [Gemmatimonadaceae bacterium]
MEVGRRIGSYEITGTLGAGAMGQVFLARDHRLGRDVAIKALPDVLAGDPEAMLRFEREARFLASLNHPNIAAIYGVEETGDERFLVLELVPGDTLDERLTRGPIPLVEALSLAVQIASALEAAHAADIVHRDLKPTNVKVTPGGRAKLLDFGIAKQTASLDPLAARSQDVTLTRAGAVIGTPQYMSPEQLFGESVDRRSDVWAFGCLLFEMLTRRPPFSGSSFLEVAERIRSAEPDWTLLPRGTPSELRRLLARCLRRNLHDRLHDIGDARIELEEIIASLPRRHRASPRRLVLALSGALAVAMAALATTLAVRGSSEISAPGSASLRLTQLTTAEGVEQFPAWAPDGGAVVYSGDVGGIR